MSKALENIAGVGKDLLKAGRDALAFGALTYLTYEYFDKIQPSEDVVVNMAANYYNLIEHVAKAKAYGFVAGLSSLILRTGIRNFS